MSTHLAPLLDELDLPAASLRAAVLDGELYPIGERFRPIDLPPDLEARAGSLRSIAVRQRILAGRTAAWIWGASHRLDHPYSVVVPSGAIVGHQAFAGSDGVRVGTARLRGGEITSIGGVRITTPLRTAIDLLREPVEPHENEVRELLRRDGLEAEDLLAELLVRRGMAGRRRAVARAQVLVTR